MFKLVSPDGMIKVQTNMNEIAVQTNSRTDFIDITDVVQSFVQQKNMTDGVITVFIPHTTAGVTINENADPDVTADMEAVFDQLVPWTNGYAHMEGNTAAHVKASMMGSSAQVIVESGRLCLGTWQSLYFCEFDGPRSRRVWLRESI
jgi:secondary thiamine-phosphate synthase enzyme